MNKKVFTVITSKAIVLPFENIDTDQILPAKFLRLIGKDNFGQYLFYHWRFNQDGIRTENVFDDSRNKERKILITGKNFGCGSSREHAVWALKDFGFKIIIASSFGDIFKHNALNNHLLPLNISESFAKKLFIIMEKEPNIEIQIDIENQELRIPSKSLSYKFDINAYKKLCLTYGYDDISYLLSMKGKIEEFEKIRENDFSLTNA